MAEFVEGKGLFGGPSNEAEFYILRIPIKFRVCDNQNYEILLETGCLAVQPKVAGGAKLPEKLYVILPEENIEKLISELKKGSRIQGSNTGPGEKLRAEGRLTALIPGSSVEIE